MKSSSVKPLNSGQETKLKKVINGFHQYFLIIDFSKAKSVLNSKKDAHLIIDDLETRLSKLDEINDNIQSYEDTIEKAQEEAEDPNTSQTKIQQLGEQIKGWTAKYGELQNSFNKALSSAEEFLIESDIDYQIDDEDDEKNEEKVK